MFGNILKSGLIRGIMIRSRDAVNLTKFSCRSDGDKKEIKQLSSVENELLKGVTLGKVSIIGAGRLGTAIAVQLLTTKAMTELCMIDIEKEKVEGELMDLQFSQKYYHGSKIYGGTDYAATKDSEVVVIAVGSTPDPHGPEEELISVAQSNVNIFRDIIPKLYMYSDNALVVVASQPDDILCYATLYYRPRVPMRLIIGIGTMLESMRFEYFISKVLYDNETKPSRQISRANVINVINAPIAGVQGKHNFPVWGLVHYAGIDIKKTKDIEESKWQEAYEDAKRAEIEIIRRKGFSNLNAAVAVKLLVNDILSNSSHLRTITSPYENKPTENQKAKIYHISMPTIVSRTYMFAVNSRKLVLTEEERKEFEKIKDIILNRMKKIKFK